MLIHVDKYPFLPLYSNPEPNDESYRRQESKKMSSVYSGNQSMGEVTVQISLITKCNLRKFRLGIQIPDSDYKFLRRCAS